MVSDVDSKVWVDSFYAWKDRFLPRPNLYGQASRSRDWVPTGDALTLGHEGSSVTTMLY